MRALVTGCGRRLGFYLCQQLLAKGWQVSGCYRQSREQLSQLAELGGELIQADLSDMVQLQALAERLAQHQDLALVIHNASDFAPDKAMSEEQGEALWQQFEHFFRVHMASPLLLNRALAPQLAKHAQANIIHITDIYIHAPPARFAAYTATKAGSHSIAMSLARELAPNVRVNTIEPGPILFLDEHDTAWRERVLAKTPLAREGGLAPIWQAVELLLANDYMTGASLKVDGGRSLADL